MPSVEKSAHKRAVADYFRSTSAAGSARDVETFQRSIVALRRRLGPWGEFAGKDVVDLGAGTGEMCCIARAEGARSVIGVNLSPEEIEFARQRVAAQFVQQDVADYLSECAPQSIDVICAFNILEHLDKDALLRVLEGAFRALRTGGRVIAMVPNATSPFGGMTRYWDITHYNAFTPSSLTQLSRLAGFGDAIAFRQCGPIPHGIISGIRYLAWQFIRLSIGAYLLVELASTKGGIYTADIMFQLTKTPERD